MLILKSTLLFISLCISGAAFTDSTPILSAKPEGDLGLVIVASDSPEFINEWFSTPFSHGVTIKRLKITKPNQLIVTAFLVTGVSPDEVGNYFFSVSYYVLDPSGKTLFGERNYAKGSGVISKVPSIIMADPALDIILENSDPVGVYTIVAQVEDLVTGKKVDNSYRIRFKKNQL